MLVADPDLENRDDSVKCDCKNPDCECPARIGDEYCCEMCSEQNVEKHCPCECGHPECHGPLS